MKTRIFLIWLIVVSLMIIITETLFAQPRVVKGIYYIKQSNRNYCGPAALAMLMNYWSTEKKYNQMDLVNAIYNEKRKVVFNSDMVYYPNQEGFIAYSFNSSMDELKKLIDNGFPLIVLQKPIKQIKKGHYRVVFGYDDEKRVFILHDPLIGGNRGIKYKDFLPLWNYGTNENTKNWTLVIFPKDNDFPFPELKETYIFHINMATAHYRRKAYKESIAEWEKAIVKSKDNPTAYPFYCLAQIQLDIGNIDEAVEYAKKAVEIDDENPFAYDVLGLAYHKKGMMVEAAETMNKAASLRDKKKHGFIQRHWLKIRDSYIRWFKKEKSKKEN